MSVPGIATMVYTPRVASAGHRIRKLVLCFVHWPKSKASSRIPGSNCTEMMRAYPLWHPERNGPFVIPRCNPWYQSTYRSVPDIASAIASPRSIPDIALESPRSVPGNA
eukprot:3940406-Rhodomonas_salina.4